MDKNYYKQYYDLERKHWWFKARERIILNKIRHFFPGNTSLKILNVGVATGRTSEALKPFGDITSIEYDAECCEFTRQKTGLDIIHGSILELPFADNTFDLVCAFDVVEHVKEDQLAVNEMKRVCKEGGVIFITVPAFQILWSHHDVVNHHFKRYTMSEIKDLFKMPENKIISKTYFNSILFLPILSVRIASRIFPKFFLKRNPGSDFTLLNEDSLVNRLSYSIFSIEKPLLNYINFPAGVSLMYAAKK